MKGKKIEICATGTTKLSLIKALKKDDRINVFTTEKSLYNDEIFEKFRDRVKMLKDFPKEEMQESLRVERKRSDPLYEYTPRKNRLVQDARNRERTHSTEVMPDFSRFRISDDKSDKPESSSSARKKKGKKRE